MDHLSSQGFNLSKSVFLCSASLCLAFPYGVASCMCTVGFPTVIWNATIYQAFPLFFKITYYGQKSYFIGNDDYKVDWFLDRCFMMFQACLLVVSLAISARSAYLSSLLILKTGHLPIFGFFLSSPGYSWTHYILWVLYPAYFLVLLTIIFICRTHALLSLQNGLLRWLLVGSRCGGQSQLSHYQHCLS